MDKNVFIGAGRVAADPHFFPGEEGDSTKDRLLFTLMVNRPRSERADAIPIVCWDKHARAGAKYINKGKTLLVEGSISTYYNREKGTNTIQVRAHAIDYGPKTNKAQVAAVVDDEPVDTLAAKLAAKAKTTTKPAADKKLALIELLVEKHGLSFADAKKTADEHFATAKKDAQPAAKTATASATQTAAHRNYDDIPF